MFGDRQAEDVLEVGEAVIAAETHLVAEERQHQGIGEGLGNDGEIHAGYPRAEGQPAEQSGK